VVASSKALIEINWHRKRNENVFLVVAALLGLIPAFIAQSKGRSFGGWWLYGFLLFIVAIIHVLFVPSLNSSGAAVNSQGP
jgi:hypothetical protein